MIEQIGNKVIESFSIIYKYISNINIIKVLYNINAKLLNAFEYLYSRFSSVEENRTNTYSKYTNYESPINSPKPPLNGSSGAEIAARKQKENLEALRELDKHIRKNKLKLTDYISAQVVDTPINVGYVDNNMLPQETRSTTYTVSLHDMLKGIQEGKTVKEILKSKGIKTNEETKHRRS